MLTPLEESVASVNTSGMAGTSTKTKVVGVRLPLDLLDWVETQGETKDVVIRALTALKDGDTKPSPGIAELEALVDAQRELRLKAEADRDQWRDRAKAIVSAAKPPTSNAEARRLAGQRQGNPVLASAVPEVAGTVGWCGLKTNGGKRGSGG